MTICPRHKPHFTAWLPSQRPRDVQGAGEYKSTLAHPSGPGRKTVYLPDVSNPYVWWDAYIASQELLGDLSIS